MLVSSSVFSFEMGGESFHHFVMSVSRDDADWSQLGNVNIILELVTM